MEEISVKGEEYVKASILAKKFGYTSDYVGQLCRSGQVKATLLGRSWYVNEASLLKHRKGRYRSSLAKTKESVRKAAEDRVTTARPLHARRLVRYVADESGLLPEIRKISDRTEILPRKPVFEPVVEELSLDISAGVAIETAEDRSVRGASVPLSDEASKSQPRSPRPVVRTILRDQPIRRAHSPQPSEKPFISPAKALKAPVRPVKGRRLAPLLSFVILAELAFAVAALGLEKKLTTITDGTDVVVYNFSPQLVSDSLKTLAVNFTGKY